MPVQVVGRTDNPDDLEGAEVLELDLDEPVAEETEEEVDLQSIITRQIEQAIAYRDDNVEEAQVEATDYYYGRELGNEEEGRSKVVSTEIRDAVLSVLPSILRIFFGSDRVVEFEPEGEEDAPGALQKTDYINHIVAQDNKGFLVFHSAFKDSMVRRLGIVKYWWNTFFRVEERRYTRLTFSQLLMLLEDDELEIDVPTLESAGSEPDPVTGEPEEVYNVRAKRRVTTGRAKIAAVPPEEVVWSADARSRDEATLFAHVREVSVDELRSMGVPDDMIKEARGQMRTERLSAGRLESVRRPEDVGERYVKGSYDSSYDRPFHTPEELPEEIEPVIFAEAYMPYDGDGDGIAELRRFDCIGPDFTIVPNEDDELIGEIVSRIPFALFPMEPEPHTILGLSFYDLLKDIQKINSQIERATLDSLGLAVEPQQEVNAKMVNMKDLLDPELSGIIRVRGPVGTNLREVGHQFVGKDTLPILQYYQSKNEKRTGQNAASQGLDPDVLQSTTKAGVAATVQAAQMRIEMIARIFAETGMADLFQGLLELVIENQDRPRTVRLRNKWVEVDPRSWNANMDVRVNVGLGTGLVEEKLAMLGMVVDKQLQLMQAGSPIVGNVEIRNTLAKITELAGWKSTAEFWKSWGPEEEQAHQEQLAANPPPPDPAVLIAQAEQVKAQAEAQTKAAKLELERQEMFLKDDRERDKIARETELKLLEIQAKYGAQITEAELRDATERDRAAMDADIQRLKALASSQPSNAGGQ